MSTEVNQKAAPSSTPLSQTRLPGIDLLRCLGLLFVTGIHFFLYNGFYNEPQKGALIWVANSFRWLFFSCNGIFMMLTGYLMSQKPMTSGYYRRLIPILISYTLTCLISYPIRHFLLGEALPLSEWISNYFSFSNYSWYIEMYIGLILISPIVNLALAQIHEPRQLLGIAGVMVLLTALPSITDLNLLPDYWTGLYPITYYVIGAVIHRLQPKWPHTLSLLGAAVVVMGMGLASVLLTDEGFSKGLSSGYGGIWVSCTVTLLFIGLYRLSIPARAAKVLAWVSGGCFEGYILSRLLDVWVYDLFPQWHTPAKYPLLFVCVTIPIFLFAVLSGKAVHSISQHLVKALNAKRR